MTRAALLVVLAIAACAPKRVAWDDPTLPEAAEEVVLLAPLGVLNEGANSDDPSLRGRALDLLIRTAPEADLAKWGKRAMWDPDGWVQRTAVDALSARIASPAAVAALDDFVRRKDDLADPYARSAAAIRLHAAGHTEVAEAIAAAWRAERAPWRAAPLQLAAVRLGDSAALAPLSKALASADIGLEPAFMLDVGASGQAELVGPLSRGDEWVEDEMRLAFDTARFLLGDDSAGKALERALDGPDPLVALEALDYLTAIPGERSAILIRKGRSGGTDLARVYANLALAARGEGDLGAFSQAILDLDPEVRALAARFAAEAAAQPQASRKATRNAKRILELALTDEDMEVRIAALQAAAAVGVLVAEPPVRVHLADELLAVRIEAAGALLARGS
jgi:hypothetical protein